MLGAILMRQMSLREFRARGSKVLKQVPQGETILLAGQNGPAYFLVPVLDDVIAEERELRRVLAKASLRKSWRFVEKLGASKKMREEDIEQEIKTVRSCSIQHVRRNLTL
jgi:antitoxin (DNA-binding transcriptional repressor) of toxin-antitoxin stability system